MIHRNFAVVAVFTGLFAARFGARLTAMVGSLITTTGFIAASFVQDAYAFFLTYGVVTAIGISGLGIGSLVPLYAYFDKHKSFAFGVLMAGYSLGYFMWPPLVAVLFSHYGWRGSFMILAGVQLQTCVLGACMRPFREGKDKIQDKDTKTSGCSGLLSHVKMFQNKPFMIYVCTLSMMSTGYAFAPTYLPTVAQENGASETSAALLVSLYGKYLKLKQNTYLYVNVHLYGYHKLPV